MKRGLIHIYYGNGKGKTTASFGLALRCLGWKKKVGIFMFLKSRRYKSGEIKLFKKIPNLKIYIYNQVHPYFWAKANQEGNRKTLLKEVKRSLQDLDNEIKRGYDLIVLDEILNLYDLGLVSKEYILNLIKNKDLKTELILTGRKCPSDLKKFADYLIEMKAHKHPYQLKIKARKGIEY